MARLNKGIQDSNDKISEVKASFFDCMVLVKKETFKNLSRLKCTMKELIMFLASICFAILFSFILFVFSIVIAALFKKVKNTSAFTPYLSVIIPTYNEEAGIEECIKSLYQQNYSKEKIELIVVDDGSTDKTVDIIRKYPIKVLTQEHKGKSEALNLGVKSSTHDFIVTVDADTIFDKDCLMHLVRPLMDTTIGATTGNS